MKKFTFLWVETFPLGFYGPAVIPLLIAYLVTTVEIARDKRTADSRYGVRCHPPAKPPDVEVLRSAPA